MNKLDSIRQQFPITGQCFVNASGRQMSITYLDHGASTHPPRAVLDIYRDFLEHYYANIHRGNHYLSQKASTLYDNVSDVVMQFVGADPKKSNVIFTCNTTTVLDIAAYLMQEVEGATLVSNMEHHSNDLPHRRRGDVHRIDVLDDGTLDYNDLEAKLKAHRIKLVAVTGGSNVTGYLPDIHRIARLAHAHGARILVDGAQLLAHKAITMRGTGDSDCIDFFTAAGHKTYAPFGAAFLVAPSELVNSASPYIPGGGTVKFVTEDDVVWADGVDRHTGGTPNIAGVIALGAVLKWISEIGLDWVRAHEVELLEYAESRLRTIPGVTVLGDVPLDRKLGVMSFNIDGLHHDSASTILNENYGVATRNGCFCAHPYLWRLLHCTDAAELRAQVAAGETPDLPGAVRATIGIFNNHDDIDKLLNAVNELASGVGVDWATEAQRLVNASCTDS
ncbi:MAG: aminotransferase class V-fold PLP-dependent enzyme [bacterium]|nr:aminotransferase class V-fold PLP-dependent enzyme [Candidatus Kapabacteria bacterium]